MSKLLKGTPVSPGIVVGIACRIEPPLISDVLVPLREDQDVDQEIAQLDRALTQAALETQSLIEEVRVKIGAEEAAIFQSHLSMIHDPALARARDLIAERGVTAISALRNLFHSYMSRIASLGPERFRERHSDLLDVLSRIETHLGTDDGLMAVSQFASDSEEGASSRQNSSQLIPILVTPQILPSQMIGLRNITIGGIVTEFGGGTSHAAILARSLGIPAVSGIDDLMNLVQNGDGLAVDGRDGDVLVRPSADETAAYRKLQREFFLIKDRLIHNRDVQAVSADGSIVQLLANINSLSDIVAAVDVGAQGVGLYRTEYLFMTHPTVPDEDEQYENYREIVESSPQQTITIRTLDLGGDKTLPYLGRRDEANPFMGWRSIRLSLEHPRLFDKQIRAILRAGRHGRVSMLFPMITTLEELRQVNQRVAACRQALKEEGIPFGEDIKTGIMIEVPAAALQIHNFLHETDFVSIGSNDLIQYLMAADRDNPRVSHLCEPLNPSIFTALKLVIDACNQTGTPVTLCGEMAGQASSVLVLFGMGLRQFSMSPAFIPTVKTLLKSVTTAQAERYAHQVAQLKTSHEIHEYLSARLKEISDVFSALEPNEPNYPATPSQISVPS